MNDVSFEKDTQILLEMIQKKYSELNTNSNVKCSYCGKNVCSFSIGKNTNVSENNFCSQGCAMNKCID